VASNRLSDGGRHAFQKIRRACHGLTHWSCSGNRAGSAAAWKASRARMAEAVWWPCVSPVDGKRVTITSGWNRRITQTTSLSTASRPQMARLSSDVLE